MAFERAVDDPRDERPRALGVGVRVEELLPHRREVDEMRGLAEVLLRDLQLGHQRRPRHRPIKRMEGLAGLEVEGPVLDLHEHVVPEASVERQGMGGWPQ